MTYEMGRVGWRWKKKKKNINLVIKFDYIFLILNRLIWSLGVFSLYTLTTWEIK